MLKDSKIHSQSSNLVELIQDITFDGIRPKKKKYVCFRLHLKKNRVVAFEVLFFSKILFIIIPDFNKKLNRLFARNT